MRFWLVIICLLLATPLAAQQANDAPGWLDRLFGTDGADDDAEQGSLLEKLIEDSLSDAGRSVTITGFQGALSGRASLDSLVISDADGPWLTLEDAVLDWNRSALFNGRLDVTELTAARIELPRRPKAPGNEAPTPEASRFQLPELPVTIEIDKIAAGNVVIGEPVFGAEAQLAVNGSLSLIDGEGAAELAIERRDGIGALRLTAGYGNTTEVLVLDFSLQEEQDGIFANLAGLPGVPSVDFSVTGNAPISDFSADVRLATNGAERLLGTVALSETDEGARRIVADIGGDIAPVFAPSYRPFFGDAIGLKAEAILAASGAISILEFQLMADAISLSGAAELAPDRVPRNIAIAGRIASDGPILLPLSGEETRVDRVDLNLSFDAEKSEDWVGSVVLAGLDRNGMQADRLALTGQGRILGGSNPQVTAKLEFDAQNLEIGIIGVTDAIGQNVTGAVDVSWEGGPVGIENLNIVGNMMSAQGNAVVSIPEAGLEVTGKLALRADRLANFSNLAGRSLGGAAELDVTFKVDPLSSIFDVDLAGRTHNLSVGDRGMDAILAGDTELILAVVRDEAGVRIDLSRLASDQARIQARADLRSGGSSASLTANLEDTSLLISELQGPSELSFEGREDAARDWEMSARLTGPTLDLSLNGKVRKTYERPTFNGQIAAVAEDLSAFANLADRPIGGRLKIDAEGQATADLQNVDINAKIVGENLKVGQPEADRLLAGVLEASLDASREGSQINIAVLDISTNLLTASASGRLTDGDDKLAIRANLADVAGFTQGISGPLTVSGSVGRQGNTLHLDLETIGPGGAQATIGGTVEQDLSVADLSARGTAPLGLANRFILPRTMSGVAGFDLRLAGPVLLQNLSGQVSTSDARLVAPTLGMALSNISGTVALAGGAAEITMQGSVDNGGRISFSGPVGLSSPNTASLKIDLVRVSVSDPRLYETTIDGNILVNGPLAGGAAISGTLNLGQTDIRIPESGFGGSGDVPEIIHINEPPPVRGTRRRAGLLDRKPSASRAGPSYPLDIAINAPNRIFVRGRGLDSEFGGGLRLTNTTADIVPLGAFELIRGRLDILGRRLLLEEAQITMQGSFTPFIRLRASTDAEEYRVNVIIEGPVDNPQITFTSSPDLPQEEVLSRLIFGRGLETLSPIQAARLALAVRTLAGQGGEGIVGKLRNQTGLADLDVTTSENGEAAVRAGTYLGENIYTDLTVDSAGETELNLNLDITRSLKAKGGFTNTGETSLGIFFERDY